METGPKKWLQGQERFVHTSVIQVSIWTRYCLGGPFCSRLRAHVPYLGANAALPHACIACPYPRSHALKHEIVCTQPSPALTWKRMPARLVLEQAAGARWSRAVQCQYGPSKTADISWQQKTARRRATGGLQEWLGSPKLSTPMIEKPEASQTLNRKVLIHPLSS